MEAVSVALLLVTLSLPGVQSSPYIISDDRIRSLDISPVLGRGYSIMTNSFQSTCLMVDETTVPSYNYDYSFYDFTKSTNMEVDMASKVSYSFGYWWFKAQYSASSSSQTKTEKKTRYINASMRIERYYASVREEVSPLSTDAATLINNEDYVGFFKACGPNYVRGIRRAQEVTAYFIFDSSSTERSTQYSASIQVSSWWWNQKYGSSNSRDTKYNSESQSMKIVIKGFGLGLSQDGSETFVAESLEDYNKVMKFAFKTMTVLPDSVHIGMVYGMEIVPWVENTQFQVQSNILDEAIEIPIIRSLIPRAFLISNPKVILFDNTSDATRALYRCKEPSYDKDKYGYCCETGSMYDTNLKEYNEDNTSERVCRPLRMLEPSFIKDNMAANGEFVARMDRSIRYKMNQLSTLERCISAVRAIPERYDYYLLKSQDSVKFDGAIDISFSVFELKMAVDPFNDYAMLKHMAKELDEFMDMFIQPCYAALFGSNVGNSPETDPSYFMAYPWHSHEECTRLSCFGNSMRWDRSSEEGGCVPSMISGSDSPSFDGGDKNCKKDIETGDLICKHNTDHLSNLHKKTVKAWKRVLPRGRVDYFMDHFCMPTLQGKKLDDQAIDTLKENYILCCTDLTEGSVNVARGKTAKQISTYPHYGSTAAAQLAVDGNTDGDMWKRSVSHTHGGTSLWWYVDLGREHKIKEVIVYNRKDCCNERLSGFQVHIEKDGTNVYTSPKNNFPTYVNKVKIPDKVGDRVRITLDGKSTHLHMAEVEVYNKFFALV